VVEEDEQDEAVPEGCSPENKRWWLELNVREEEGERELESMGERCWVL
jgi:hypothetical protein